MNRQGRALLALTLILMLSLTAVSSLAGEEVSRSGKASADGVVYIENIVGSVEVVGWDREEISIEGYLGDDVEELKFETGKRKSYIEVEYPRRGRNLDDGAELVIKVPRGSRLDIETVSASVTVSGVEGAIEAESVSGRVEVMGGGKVVEASSVSGTVLVESGAREIVVESVSGKVKLRGEKADVRASTVSAAIDLVMDQFLGLEVETVSGDIEASGELHGKGDFAFDSVNGNITLVVPGDTSAEFQVTTFNGGIDNEFGQKARRTSRYAPGKELEFSVGGGDAEVEINSFNGNIRIKKR
jgi:DUF4097 and DUF4098 domain-containing protein YvlB